MIANKHMWRIRSIYNNYLFVFFWEIQYLEYHKTEASYNIDVSPRFVIWHYKVEQTEFWRQEFRNNRFDIKSAIF